MAVPRGIFKAFLKASGSRLDKGLDDASKDELLKARQHALEQALAMPVLPGEAASISNLRRALGISTASDSKQAQHARYVALAEQILQIEDIEEEAKAKAADALVTTDLTTKQKLETEARALQQHVAEKRRVLESTRRAATQAQADLEARKLVASVAAAAPVAEPTHEPQPSGPSLERRSRIQEDAARLQARDVSCAEGIQFAVAEATLELRNELRTHDVSCAGSTRVAVDQVSREQIARLTSSLEQAQEAVRLGCPPPPACAPCEPGSTAPTSAAPEGTIPVAPVIGQGIPQAPPPPAPPAPPVTPPSATTQQSRLNIPRRTRSTEKPESAPTPGKLEKSAVTLEIEAAQAKRAAREAARQAAQQAAQQATYKTVTTTASTFLYDEDETHIPNLAFWRNRDIEPGQTSVLSASVLACLSARGNLDPTCTFGNTSSDY